MQYFYEYEHVLNISMEQSVICCVKKSYKYKYAASYIEKL